MKLIFEKSAGNLSVTDNDAYRANASYLSSECVGSLDLPDNFRRAAPPRLPNVAESEAGRHYSMLARRSFGVNSGFYPLGSCTMKYNPAAGEEAARLPGFTGVHPLQGEGSAQGCLEVLYRAERLLCEITGMDAMNFSPAAGAHGELTGLMMIKAYHASRGDVERNEIIVPDSAHGTNPASATMAGFKTVNLPSAGNGEIDLDKLKSVVGDKTAGLMLTNPNTLGLFERGADEAARIVHAAGGLMYYDGANLNAIMGVARPGDMGFDVLHLNLHKTFATPHGGGGPGSGPVGCKAALEPFLPAPRVSYDGVSYKWERVNKLSIGRVKRFHGNFLVVVRALAYIVALGAEGVAEASQNAVLNANYLLRALSGNVCPTDTDSPYNGGDGDGSVYNASESDGGPGAFYPNAGYPDGCMHEFVVSLESLKKKTGVSALDVAKTMMDCGCHPPTMYFPLIVREALMFEPTETETKETLDEAASILLDIYRRAQTAPDDFHNSPAGTPVSRPDEASAARNLRLRYTFDS